MKLPKGWRTGQTIFNFLEWLKEVKGIDGNQNQRMADPFYIPNAEFDILYWEFLEHLKKQGIEV